MDFDELVAKAKELLKSEDSVSYVRIKHKLGVDNSLLSDLKEELAYVQKVAIDDKERRSLVWIGKAFISPDEVDGERKHVTALFVDIKDSVKLIEEMDIEDSGEMIASARKIMIEAVNENGGTVDNLMGDGIIALFGAPFALEDHAIRSCRAALEMQSAMRVYSDQVRSALGKEILIRVGIDSGEVVVGNGSGDKSILVQNTNLTMSMASRMEGLADAGAILITEETQRLGGDHLKVKELNSRRVQGVSEPVKVFELLEVSPVTHPDTQALTPYIGRTKELADLSTYRGLAEAGHGQVVRVIGEAGVGKSRLIDEFLRSDCVDGWSTWKSISASYTSLTPYNAIIDLLKRHFLVEDANNPDFIRASIENKVLSLDKALKDTIVPLQALMDVLPLDNSFLQHSPERQRQLIRDAIKAIIVRMCHNTPMILIFEDLHWLDSETEVFIDSLIQVVPTAKLLLVLSYRPEYEHEWADHPFFRKIKLEPLSLENTEEFLDICLGNKGELEALKELLIDRTQGNPLFLEESIRMLVEMGYLRGSRGHYHLGIGITFSNIHVPSRVQAIIEARIDRLPPDAKKVLQLASVIKHKVSFKLLTSLTTMQGSQLSHWLNRLQELGFLYETHQFPDREYTFRHTLVQEVAYNCLLRRHRDQYHADVGMAIEKAFPDRKDENLEILAYHYGLSKEDEKAVEFALLAAEKLQRRWANSEALDHFNSALDRLQGMPDNQTNQLKRIDAVLNQAEVKFALGQHAGHIADLKSIQDIVEKSADRKRYATWLYWMGFLHSFTGSNLEMSINYCNEALIKAKSGEFSEIQAKAESCLSQVYYFAGDLEKAHEAGENALEIIESDEAGQNIWWACRTMWHLSTTANAMGKWDLSEDYCRRSLEYGKIIDDLRLKIVGTWRLGAVFTLKGHPDKGLELCNEAMKLSPDLYDQATIEAAMGHALVKKGQLEEGITKLKKSLNWFEEKKLHYTYNSFILFLGEVYLNQGKLREARKIFEGSLAASKKGGYKHVEGNATRLLGDSYAVDAPERALGLLESARETYQTIGAQNDLGKALTSLAAVHMQGGNYNAAKELLTCAIQIFDSLGTIDEYKRVESFLEDI